ncbi:LysE family translocator [Novacetimonas hansenii]|uniref:LysE family translocator n=1 Tax=Novacetimonas hansenii TaxID=436 RepID=UPI00094FE332|nr:LysE family translocator [Novacetimonas hansenii]
MSLIAFVAAASLLTITPGLDTAMVLRVATSSGTRPALMAGLGVALGCLVWGIAASLGLGAVLRASELAYNLIKWSGAAYLCWLGINLLLHPRTNLTDGMTSSMASASKALRQGFLTNILNPKVGIFYVTFLPQFMPPSGHLVQYALLLTSIHAMLTVLWFSILAMATAPLLRLLKRPRFLSVIDRLTGGLFIAFGLKIALSKAR